MPRFLFKLLPWGWGPAAGAEPCSQQALVCTSCFSTGEQKVLSACAHVVAPFFIAVYSFSWNHPQGKFICAVTLFLSETQLGHKINKFLKSISLTASSAPRSLWCAPSFPSYTLYALGFAHSHSILRKCCVL